MGTAVMAAWFYILTLLTLIARGCPPPFNDFRYANNDTLLREVIDQARSNPQLGWSHVIGGTSPVKTWPADQQGTVSIPYCWANDFSKKKFGRRFMQAWVKWSRMIGPPSAQSGHRLGGFREVTDAHGGPIFCNRDDDQNFWEKSIPPDTLVIKAVLNSHGSSGSLGYKPNSWSVQADPISEGLSSTREMLILNVTGMTHTDDIN